MGNISSWLNDVSGKIPGATKDDIDSVVLSTIRHFCSKTQLYTRQLTAINIVIGIVDYTLTPPVNTAIVGIERVEINGVPTQAVSKDFLDRSLDAWRTQSSNQSDSIMVDVEKVLTLKQIPTENYTGGLVVWVSLKPSPTTTIVPDFIYDDWYDAILCGALSRLFEIPGKPWFNTDTGLYYADKYDGELKTAKAKKITGIAKMSLRVQQSPFSVI